MTYQNAWKEQNEKKYIQMEWLIVYWRRRSVAGNILASVTPCVDFVCTKYDNFA